MILENFTLRLSALGLTHSAQLLHFQQGFFWLIKAQFQDGGYSQCIKLLLSGYRLIVAML